MVPCPTLTNRIELPADVDEAVAFTAIPARAGVFVLEDASGRTLALATTANLRRMIKAKLTPPYSDAGPSRRVDYGSLARQAAFITVGSAFEADWVYLQLARQRLPSSYRALLDRWQAWFVWIDPHAEFPQWLKTARPNRPPAATTTHGRSRPASDDTAVSGDEIASVGETTSGGGGIVIGPMPDKHAAARYLHLLEDAFDLCRYHHILIQAPHASACAYKEMGRCPAPCDGSVSMASYRQQIAESIEFASTPIQQWRAQREQIMKNAVESLAFETAKRCRDLLDRTAKATRREYAQLGNIESFRLIAVMPSEHKGYGRLFVIAGGWVEPFADLPLDASKAEADSVVHAAANRAASIQVALTVDALENIGLVCWHLFRPKSKAIGEFLRVDDALDHAKLRKALARLKEATTGNDAVEGVDPSITEQETDAIG